jgi:hypothetical protein
MQTTRLESGREMVISRQKDSERQKEVMYPDIPQQLKGIIPNPP